MLTQSELHADLYAAERREAILMSDLEACRDDIALLRQAIDPQAPRPTVDEAARTHARYAIREAATTVWQLAKRDEMLGLIWFRLDGACVQITHSLNRLHPELPLIGRAV